jgi:hypothetical protein
MSRKALTKIGALAEDLLKGLPVAQNAAEKLRASANTLKKIADISF